MEVPDFTVVLTGGQGGGAEALKAVRAATGLSLWRSRQLLDSAPVTVVSDVPFDIAAPMARDLRAAGVPTALRCGWCRRTLPGDDTSPVDPGPCASRYWPTAHCEANSMTSCDCGFCTAYGPLPGYTTP
ncbi:ribosomal protein L7/L12 [Kitasatospora sp. NPDC058063]|uniref:ribosomal protein L7/L12 n=1 Tax=unclassified Kitasatospora TaxID=2633591 RepID=UPI0036D7AF6F